MKIKNTEGLTVYDLQKEIHDGSKFVYYPYTLSLGFFSFRCKSALYFTRPNETRIIQRYFFILLSFVFGWWGIPSGPKYTIKAIRTNLRGGKDVTNEVMAVMTGYALFEESQHKRKRTKLYKINL